MWINIPHRQHKNASIIAIVLIIGQAVYTAFFIKPTIHVLGGEIYLFKEEAFRSYTLPVTVRNFFLAQFCVASVNIHSRFKALNDHLQRFLDRKSSTFNFKIGTVFSNLCDSIELLNATFTFPFVFMFANLLTFSIIAAFGVIKEIFQKSAIPAVTLYLNTYCLVSYLGVIVAVCRNGALVTERAQKTVGLVAKIMDQCNLNCEQKAEMIFLSAKMRMRNLQVENFLFTINWNSLLTVKNFY